MNCPVCSTPVKASWKNTNLKQCSCNAILYLTEAGNWSIASSSLIRIPSRYIKTGTEAVCEKKKFIVTGRVFAQNEEAALNFWSIAFEDGSRALMMEGYGHFSIMEKTTPAFEIDFNSFKRMDAGDKAISKSKKHRLVRKETFFKITAEGENEWGDAGNGFEVYDFFCYDGQYTTLLRFSGGEYYAFDCRFFVPADLKFSNTVAALPAKKHTCSNCNCENDIYAYPFTFSVNCKKCKIRYAYDIHEDAYVKTKSRDDGHEPHIALGSTGVLDGIEFKVIGYARKKETASQAEWNEYTMYNPQMGFAYLSEFEGHWVYVKEWPRPPLITSEGADYFVENENEFEIFNDYYYKVIGAVGEHIYNFDNVTGFAVKEFIYPPQILTQEKSTSEENWFYGDHIDAKKVKNTFTFPNGMPHKKGVGAVEPLAFVNKNTLFLVTIIGITLLLLAHLTLNYPKQQKILFEETVYFGDSLNTLTGITPHFSLDKKESNIEMNLSAPVINSWVEVEGSFVNTTTGKEYNFNKGVEFYEGIDGGDRWTEGSRDASVIITEIPAGSYYLEYKVVKDSISYQSRLVQGVSMKVQYDVALTRNLLWAIGFVVAVAVVQFALYYYNDKRRWENSKYTPYSYE